MRSNVARGGRLSTLEYHCAPTNTPMTAVVGANWPPPAGTQVFPSRDRANEKSLPTRCSRSQTGALPGVGLIRVVMWLAPPIRTRSVSDGESLIVARAADWK